MQVWKGRLQVGNARDITHYEWYILADVQVRHPKKTFEFIVYIEKIANQSIRQVFCLILSFFSLPITSVLV